MLSAPASITYVPLHLLPAQGFFRLGNFFLEKNIRSCVPQSSELGCSSMMPISSSLSLSEAGWCINVQSLPWIATDYVVIVVKGGEHFYACLFVHVGATFTRRTSQPGWREQGPVAFFVWFCCTETRIFSWKVVLIPNSQKIRKAGNMGLLCPPPSRIVLRLGHVPSSRLFACHPQALFYPIRILMDSSAQNPGLGPRVRAVWRVGWRALALRNTLRSGSTDYPVLGAETSA